MKKTATLLLALILLCGAVSALAEVYINKDRPADWESRDLLRLTCLHTPLNDAMLLEAGGRVMLIDGGSGKWWENVMKAISDHGYGQHVDVIYNTHPHDDHAEGITWMLKHHGLTADELISTFPKNYRSECQKKLMVALEMTNTPYRQLENGEQMDFGGVHMVFWYDPDGKDPNALSSVCRITWKTASVLLTGDMTGASSKFFMKNFSGEELRSDIMKAPHHGLVRMNEDFLNMISPEFVFITNRESSSKKFSDQIKRHRIPTLRNTFGEIVMETDGTDWYVTMVKMTD